MKMFVSTQVVTDQLYGQNLSTVCKQVGRTVLTGRKAPNSDGSDRRLEVCVTRQLADGALWRGWRTEGAPFYSRS